mmetsp:Transcript_84547/g.266891  ORF Transcript_84547/g.266891 Transcript_84547/m.266891 type:complete len:261 (-) Transcript_84547:542-1324(-)
MFPTASASASMCFVLASLITVSWLLKFCVSSSKACLFLRMVSVSSSTWSRNLPHSRDIRSCRSPQFASPVHFLHCPSGWGSSCTGMTSTANCNEVVVVVVFATRPRRPPSCARPRGPLTWPRASRRASRASGVNLRSTSICSFGLLKSKVRPSFVLQTLTRGWAASAPFPRSWKRLVWPGWQAVRLRMKSKTARSFWRRVNSTWFLCLVEVNCVVVSSYSFCTCFRSASYLAIPLAAFTRFSPRFASWEPNLARSFTTCS